MRYRLLGKPVSKFLNQSSVGAATVTPSHLLAYVKALLVMTGDIFEGATSNMILYKEGYKE